MTEKNIPSQKANPCSTPRTCTGQTEPKRRTCVRRESFLPPHLRSFYRRTPGGRAASTPGDIPLCLPRTESSCLPGRRNPGPFPPKSQSFQSRLRPCLAFRSRTFPFLPFLLLAGLNYSWPVACCLAFLGTKMAGPYPQQVDKNGEACGTGGRLAGGTSTR